MIDESKSVPYAVAGFVQRRENKIIDASQAGSRALFFDWAILGRPNHCRGGGAVCIAYTEWQGFERRYGANLINWAGHATVHSLLAKLRPIGR